MATRFEVDWDPAKAASNRSRHGVTFDEAMTVFLDPLALSRLDEDHGESEERWVTLGLSAAGRLVLVVHTHAELADDRVSIRLISARRPTRRETSQYEEESVR
ncbi:MAG TPA: BrnT family toxin [Caulobacteraceae bacterium]|nr:BrnT family toxin [Caulobacteraceae bacterium]